MKDAQKDLHGMEKDVHKVQDAKTGGTGIITKTAAFSPQIVNKIKNMMELDADVFKDFSQLRVNVKNAHQIQFSMV